MTDDDRPRCLSVKQPWADPIVDGLKPIENRSHGFTRKFRGRLLIASSKGWSNRGAHDQRVQAAYPPDGMNSRGYALRHVPAYGGFPPHPFTGGAILGSVEVVDIHDDCECCRPWGESEYDEANGRTRRGLVHLVFEDARRLKVPVRVSGRLGLWIPTDEALAECASVLE